MESIDQEIARLQKRIKELREQKRWECPHKNIVKDYYLEGDDCWPQQAHRVDFKQCKDCGKRWIK